MKTVTFPIQVAHWDRKRNLQPIIECKLELVSVTLLIDTGASQSIIDAGFVKKNQMMQAVIEDSKHILNFTDLAGGPAKCERIVKSEKLKIGNHNFPIELYEMSLWNTKVHKDLYYHGILGFNFLAKYRANVDFNKFQLTLSF